MTSSDERLVSRAGGLPALVIGGAGFIGRHLCRRLLDDGIPVTCVDNLITSRIEGLSYLLDDKRFTFVQADICNRPDLPGRNALVFNLASLASPRDYGAYPIETLRVGSIGTMYTQDLAIRDHARYVFASTSEVYGEPLRHPQDEGYRGNVDPVGPRSQYDESKRFSEAYTSVNIRVNGLDGAIARIFNTYGPGMRTDDGRAISEFAVSALTGRAIRVTGDGSQTRSFMYIDDCIDALIALAANDVAGPINIGSTEEQSVLYVAKLIRELSGTNSEIEFSAPAPDDPSRRQPNIARARQLLGWSPKITLSDGLARTIAWYSQELVSESRTL